MIMMEIKSREELKGQKKFTNLLESAPEIISSWIWCSPDNTSQYLTDCRRRINTCPVLPGERDTHIPKGADDARFKMHVSTRNTWITIFFLFEEDIWEQKAIRWVSPNDTAWWVEHLSHPLYLQLWSSNTHRLGNEYSSHPIVHHVTVSLLVRRNCLSSARRGGQN